MNPGCSAVTPKVLRSKDPYERSRWNTVHDPWSRVLVTLTPAKRGLVSTPANTQPGKNPVRSVLTGKNLHGGEPAPCTTPGKAAKHQGRPRFAPSIPSRPNPFRHRPPSSDHRQGLPDPGEPRVAWQLD